MSKNYRVKKLENPVNCSVSVPGSKSITNRALLLAALSTGKSKLTNVLFSDDTRHFMDCLIKLGFELEINEDKKTVIITGGKPIKKSEIYVGSAGTAARFLPSLLAVSNGEYIINASDQMKARPMKPLFDALIELGADIEYLEKEGCLPVKLIGKEGGEGGAVFLPTDKSSQFLSSLLMVGGFYKNGLNIKPIGREIALSYVDITINMIRQFGGKVHKLSDNWYKVDAGNNYISREYNIEPDVSSASYFFAAAALTGGSALVKNVYLSSMQGDIKFLNVLKKLGCKVTETEEGILVTGPKNGKFNGVEVDLNDYSDQTMTLAALAPFADSPTIIRNIEHIKYQESNRIQAIINELTKMGISCREIKDGIIIYPGCPKPTIIETYNDHRMAMAFALIGLKVEGFEIANPTCTSKTFENYFEILDDITSTS